MADKNIPLGPLDQKPQNKKEYDEAVEQNYPYNRNVGFIHGVLHFAGLGFFWRQTILPNFVHALTGSDFLVGLTTSVGFAFTQGSQLFGSALVEHLAVKKKPLLWFGILSRIPWFFIAMAVLLLSRDIAFPVFISLYVVASSCMGLYLLVWTDLMSKVIPVKNRGSYFAIRNFLAACATALAGILAGRIIEIYLYPTGYALSFFLAFLVMSIDLFVIARTKEVPSLVVNPKVTIKEKLSSIPLYLSKDKNYKMYCIVRSYANVSRQGVPFYILAATAALELSPQEAAATAGLFTFALLLTQTVGNLIWGYYSQGRGWKAPLEAVCLLIGIVSFVVPSITTLAGFIVIVGISGLSNSGFMLPSLNILMEFGRPQHRSSYIGIANGISAVGALISPLLAGAIAQWFSYTILFYFVGINSLISFALLKFLVTDPRHVPEEEKPDFDVQAST